MGWRRLEEGVRGAGGDGPGVIPYVTVGFPSLEATMALVPALEEAGAAAVELGVPFSDPLADGATIQRASLQALRAGVTLARCLEVCSALRARGVVLPLVLMGYYNPLLAYGLEGAARDAAGAGVDGLIVADLPSEESGPLLAACSRRGLALVPLLAPTSTGERVARACSLARGFVYCVSLAGVTGARAEVPEEAAGLVEVVRGHTGLPVAVGFGVSGRRQVEALGRVADAVVVGSALMDAISAVPEAAAADAARGFLAGLLGRPYSEKRGSP